MLRRRKALLRFSGEATEFADFRLRPAMLLRFSFEASRFAEVFVFAENFFEVSV